MLRSELNERLALGQDDCHKSFVQYRFVQSARAKARKHALIIQAENEEIDSFMRVDTDELKLKSKQVLGKIDEQNLFAATWAADIGQREDNPEMPVFFNNEELLERELTSDHFHVDSKSLMLQKGIDFTCTKGASSSKNNLFIIIDGDLNIFGVFNGFGPEADSVSKFAQCRMVDWIS